MSADLHDLLVKTSRTFALSIPRLGGSLLDEVRVAYLLLRIADTFEDAYRWSKARRVDALSEFSGLFEKPDRSRAEAASSRWLADPEPTDHEGYTELLAAAPDVLSALDALPEPNRRAICAHVRRTVAGMVEFVDRTDDAGNLTLRDVEDLRAYCYVVAGIVGEMLTDLFVLHDDALLVVADELRARAPTFGEALQLVNITKDALADAGEGRTFLPPQIDRKEIFEIARSDLETAAEYVRLLEGAGVLRGPVEFCALPVLLARATLDEVERHGPGAKVARDRVLREVAALDRRLEHGEPALA